MTQPSPRPAMRHAGVMPHAASQSHSQSEWARAAVGVAPLRTGDPRVGQPGGTLAGLSAAGPRLTGSCSISSPNRIRNARPRPSYLFRTKTREGTPHKLCEGTPQRIQYHSCARVTRACTVGATVDHELRHRGQAAAARARPKQPVPVLSIVDLRAVHVGIAEELCAWQHRQRAASRASHRTGQRCMRPGFESSIR